MQAAASIAMLDMTGDKHSQSEECGAAGSNTNWGFNPKLVPHILHEGLSSSQSSVSVGRPEEQASPQNSVSSTLKEHDYIGMNEVSSSFNGSAKENSGLQQCLNLQETELRLGPVNSSNKIANNLLDRSGDVRSGASFQPKSHAAPDCSGGGAIHSEAAGTVSAVYNSKTTGEDVSETSKGLDLGISLSSQKKAGSLESERKPSSSSSSTSSCFEHESQVVLKSYVPEAAGKKEVGETNNKQAGGPSKTGVAGAKRVFAEAIGGDGNFTEGRSGFPMLAKLSGGLENPLFAQLSKHPLLPPLYPWKKPYNMSSKVGKVENPEAQQEKEDACDDTAGASSTRAPVGWPPVQSFRKSTLAVPQPKKHSESSKLVVSTSSTPTQLDPASPYVKVYMDGVSIGRKVELKSHDSYEKLAVTLEEMFQHHISGQSTASKDKIPAADKQKLNFLSDTDYVLTYEDKDGDLMLVGDVPWKMFVGTVKRLRIMKGSDAIGLAPRAPPEVV